MKLLILSDIHNEFSVLPYPATEADMVILAGDIDTSTRGVEWATGFEKPVLYVAGNHEYYDGHYETIQKQIRNIAQGTSVCFLENEAIILNGIRFIGCTLWTDFKLFGEAASVLAEMEAMYNMNDYRAVKKGEGNFRLRPIHTIQFFEESLAFLKGELATPYKGPTVVITHHAPSLQSIEAKYKQDRLTPAFASDLEYLMGPSVNLWIHGHVHHSNDYWLNGTRIVSNPRGYQSPRALLPENPDFNPALIVEI